MSGIRSDIFGCGMRVTKWVRREENLGRCLFDQLTPWVVLVEIHVRIEVMPNTLLPIRLPLNCRGRKDAIGTDARKSGRSTADRAFDNQHEINTNGFPTLTLFINSGAAVEICL